MNSGYGKDILQETIGAIRKHGISVGLYFTPDDFYFLNKQGYLLDRESPEASSTTNSALWENNKKQIAELLSNYGPIDLFYVDEKRDWGNILVANYVWSLNPDIMITGGGMEIEENFVPQKNIPSEWLGVFSLESSNRWEPNKKFRNEEEVIRLLTETRSKGGNFLLSISIGPNGDLDEEQETTLRKTGLWIRRNMEAINKVKPWNISYENGCRFTSSATNNIIYVFLDEYNWKPLEEKAFFFRSIAADKNTRVSILGQANGVLAYPANKSIDPIYTQVNEGFFINIIKTPGNGSIDDLPTVIRIENIKFKDSVSTNSK